LQLESRIAKAKATRANITGCMMRVCFSDVQRPSLITLTPDDWSSILTYFARAGGNSSNQNAILSKNFFTRTSVGVALTRFLQATQADWSVISVSAPDSQPHAVMHNKR
jgi:hypothetical protein